MHMGTGLQLNTVNCSFGGVNIKKVTNFSPDPGGALISFSGDDDRFPTVVVHAMSNPSISLTSGDIGTMGGFSEGTEGTFTATMQDAKKVVGGSLVWTCATAVFQNHTPATAHGSFGTTTGHWLCYSADGQTRPLTFSTS